MNSSGTELLVASSTGIGVSVKNKLIQAFERWGLEIVGINQCRDVKFNNSKSLEFLRGGSPTWEIFHYNESASGITRDSHPWASADFFPREGKIFQ
jgi:hypothetical protein